MAKANRNCVIGEADLVEYLDNESDFAFELECLELLSSFRSIDDDPIQHGGSYVDPVTGRDRQFDIRAPAMSGAQGNLFWLAVECKNLRQSFPLLVSRVPRQNLEANHHVLVPLDDPTNPVAGNRRTCDAFSLTRIYRAGEPVGKDCCQVGRQAGSKGDLVFNDSEVFEKWSQALASANDLVWHAAASFRRYPEFNFSALIVPVLVVPDGRLWCVDYHSDGSRSKPPTQADRCSFFVGKPYSKGAVSIRLTHLEIVTSSGLRELVKELKSDTNWYMQQGPRRV